MLIFFLVASSCTDIKQPKVLWDVSDSINAETALKGNTFSLSHCYSLFLHSLFLLFSLLYISFQALDTFYISDDTCEDDSGGEYWRSHQLKKLEHAMVKAKNNFN